ncbi:serine dehydratase subunit alpha family protein [Pseudoflavonifractor phocaeensis]|uniref:L-cysteine desulfidase family protein n=1 Tax=Pseudoflavonifractor phocaeensis TaxID=1870988 RepID=UPI001956BE19|nr:L-serine ammonia-lyase, iron-sulfur-dependent, subunit alpha [Pseudoflavonifractor phocaeensis]MBM6939211.1 serine dehydratase subunit alpha family protein [Pseudoflavonifractor phocaeensis]
MDRNDLIYRTYVRILEEELQPAMGCTEPVALAWAAAKVCRTLGGTPERLRVAVSGNLMKNVKSVVVPNTGGLRGIEASVAAGASVGDADAMLEVLSQVREEQHETIRAFLRAVPIRVEKLESPAPLDMELEAAAGTDRAVARITGEHTNLVYLARNDRVLVDRRSEAATARQDGKADRSLLNVADIVDFAQCVALEDVRPLLERQLSYNMAIAEEGLRGEYGAGVGATLMESGGGADRKARAMAAAGSDARMSGCGLPVVIVSGSGNQGITASVPVAVYAREKGYGEERLLRALALSDLLTVHQKAYIGVLSAYCGAVSAGCAAAGAIAWLDGGGYDAVAHTVVNGLAMAAGIVCDGAKASCAGKIAMAVESGLLGYHMYRKGHQFWGGEGIVIRGVDNTIRNVGALAREGMKETDRKIVELMLEGLGSQADAAGC